MRFLRPAPGHQALLNGFAGCVVITVGAAMLGNTSYLYPGIVLPTIVGRKAANHMLGWSMMFCSLTATIAPTLGAAMTEATGSLTAAMMMSGAVFVVGILFTVFGTSQAVKNRVSKHRPVPHPGTCHTFLIVNGRHFVSAVHGRLRKPFLVISSGMP